MDVNLDKIEGRIAPSNDKKMLKQQKETTVKEENKNCTKATTMIEKTEFTINDNDDSALLASLPKAEVKIRKLECSKLQLDNNENSLSVDTLIEILSANEKIPTPAATVSTFSSPSSASSSSGKSKTSPGPSPKSTPKKFPSPYHLNGGKPMISDMNKKMKQVAKRQPKTLYQSKISENKLGIKISIKKSTDALKSSLPSPNSKSGKRRSRKSKAKEHESDSDEAYVKRRKKSSTSVNNNNNNTKSPFDEPIEQTGWGKEMPKEILFDVSFGECFSSFFQLLTFPNFLLDLQNGSEGRRICAYCLPSRPCLLVMA